MSNLEDRRVAGGWAVLPGVAFLVIALVLMVVAVFFFGTGLRDGFIETGGSAVGMSAMLVAFVSAMLGIVSLGVSAGRTTRFVRPRGLLGLVIMVPVAWLAMTMAVSWYYVGAMSVADPDVEYDVGDDPGAHPENKFSDTSGVVSLLGCGGTLFLGGFAVLCVVGLLRTDASGNDGGNTLSRGCGD